MRTNRLNISHCLAWWKKRLFFYESSCWVVKCIGLVPRLEYLLCMMEFVVIRGVWGGCVRLLLVVDCWLLVVGWNDRVGSEGLCGYVAQTVFTLWLNVLERGGERL